MVGGLRASAMCRFPANAPHLYRWGTVEVGGAVVSGSRSLPLRSSDGPIAKGVGAELECAAADGPVSTELTNVLFVQKHGTLEYISRCDSLDQLPKCCEIRVASAPPVAFFHLPQARYDGLASALGAER